MLTANPERAGHASPPPASEPRTERHQVYLYETDHELAERAARFVAEGLAADQPVLVLATDHHAAALRARLAALGVDLRGALERGRLHVVDAHAMLGELLVDGAPDRARFHARVGSALDRVAPGDEPVRVFGEMVDLLCRQGRPSAALALEKLWSELGAARRVSVLLACSKSNMLGLESEVAERRRLEAALRRCLADQERIAAELREESRAKDEFIAMLSHELRGPLAAIRSALQLMGMRGEGGGARERAIVERQVENLVRLVDDLLDASRIAVGKMDLQRARIDLAGVIEMAVEIAAPALHARGHALQVRAARGLAFVDGDAVRLAQVVANLLSNAAKYTERNGRITVGLEVAGDEVLLSVRDTGIGMEPDLLPRVFDRGVQGAHGVGGLGLGLTIVRALVELHGGTISAHSEGRGCGSEFRVRLPLAAPAATTADPPRPAPPAHDGVAGSRLLIVDDDADLADTLAELLEARGFVTRVARDGEEAVRAFAQFRPQAALIDISLPVMDGRELARRLRESGSDATLIALSGFGRREDEELSLASGFDLHLVKPVRADVIEAHLRAIAGDRG